MKGGGGPESIPVRVRLSDVARAAGVSLSTASRALSGVGASKDTVDAVLAAATRLGYRPDPVARSLRTRSTGLVGIIVPGLSNPFFAELVEALERALGPRGLEMILADSCGSAEVEARRLEMLLDRQVDGLIVIPTHHEASATALRRAAQKACLVQVDRHVDAPAGDYVGVDNAAGVRAMLEHVASLSCKDVVFVSETGASSTGRSRLEAFELGVGKVDGLVPRPPILGSFSLDFGRDAVRQLLANGPLPDALICGADLIALGVARELHRQEVLVPDTVKVTGFDDILFAELSDPPLTTLRQPVTEIADEAARLLGNRLAGDLAPPRRSEIAPSLVVRRSSLPDAD